MRRGVVAVAILALATSLALSPAVLAHGGGDNGGATYFGPSHHPVGIFNNGFEQGEDTLAVVRDYVDWKNDDNGPHHVKCDAIHYDSGAIPAYSQATWIPNATGNFTFYLADHPSATYTFSVKPIPGVNHPPVVAITSLPNGATVHGIVTVKGTANDPDGDWMTIRMRVDENPWHVVSDSMYNGTWSKEWDTHFVVNGLHNLTVAAQDDQGAYSYLFRIALTVHNTNDSGTNPSGPPPTVEITSPQDGDRVGGYVVIDGTATSTDPNARLLIQVNVDGTYWAPAAGAARWTFAWDARSAPDGEHTVMARATDGHLVSEIVTFHYTIGSASNDGPVASILTPSDHATVRGPVTVSGNALDPKGGDFRVYLRIDGGPSRLASGTGRWSYTWHTDEVGNGVHAVEVYAKGKNGSGEPQRVSVSVDNANSRVRPSVALLYPGAADELTGPVTLRGTANTTQNNAIKVQVKIDDGPWRLADGGAAWSYVWNSTEVGNGVHHLTVRAYDGYATSQEASGVLLVTNAGLRASGHSVARSVGTSNDYGATSGGGSHFLPGPSPLLAVGVLVALAALRPRRH